MVDIKKEMFDSYVSMINGNSKWQVVERINILIPTLRNNTTLSKKELQYIIKKAWLKFVKNSTNNKFLKLLQSGKFINHGRIYSRWMDGEIDTNDWKDWYIVKANNLENAMKIFNDYDSSWIEEDRNYSVYDCSGKLCSDKMTFTKICEGRFLAVKRFYYDV